MAIEFSREPPPYTPPCRGVCGERAETKELAPGAGPVANDPTADGGMAVTWRVLCLAACLLFWNLRQSLLVLS